MTDQLQPVAVKTVLCVDDERIGLRVRKIMLEGHGFNVLTASDGRQGLAVFDENKVDLVVLDYFMPDMNGGEVAAELRRRRPDLPIIFLSAYFSLPPEALELANAFITKGDPPDALLEKIETTGPVNPLYPQVYEPGTALGCSKLDLPLVCERRQSASWSLR